MKGLPPMFSNYRPTLLKNPGLTVIPPGPVTDKIRVEVRLSVPNPSSEAREYTLSLYWDKADPQHRIATRTVTAPPHSYAYLSGWWPTAGRAGEHKILYRIEGPEGRREGEYPIQVIASETRALPLLQGGWFDALALSSGYYEGDRGPTEQDVRDMVDAMKRIGMNVLIFTYVEYKGWFFYPSQISFYDREVDKVVKDQKFSFDVVGTVLSQADKNGMHVFLGLGRSGDLWLLWQFEKEDWQKRNEEAIDIATRIAAELWEKYHHHPSLYGWYLTHEMNDLAKANAYYNPVAEFCHRLAPDKPVLIAPAGTPIVDTESLRATKVDIFAYQDAVGSGYVPYKNTFNPENRIAMLHDIYKKYRDWHEGSNKHLWSDLEIWEMDGSQGYGGSYPPKWERVKRQIDIQAQYVDFITAYTYPGMMEAPDSKARLKDRRAAKLYADYEAYYKKVRPGPGAEWATK
jgi:hypothetical protein